MTMTVEIVKNRPAKILLVDDDLGDVKMTLEAFKAFKVPLKVFRARDGEEAIDYLRQRGEHRAAPRPDLIFLDLNMPKKNGFEVLFDIKSDPDLKAIPVLVLTGSKAPEDMHAAYEAKANFYMVKPSKVDQYFAAMNYVEEFWLKGMELTAE
jgi:chemotaxis family two-component system response regulator Rcp1